MLKKHLTKPLIILTSLLQLMLISYTSSVNGEVIKWKENGTTVSSTEANKLFPSVTGDGSGGAFLAWEDYRNTTGDIFVQRVNVNGTPLSSDKDATVDDTAAKRFPSIVKDGNGGAFIVWEDDRNKASGKGADIYIQKIDSNGNPVWTDTNGIPEDKIVCSLAGNQWVPQIILTNDSTGDVIVTWEDHRNGMIGDIFAQRIGPDGSQKWTTDGKPVCTDASDQLYPAISSAGGGGAVIVWWDDRNSSSDIYGQRLDADGNIASGGQWVTDGIAITDADGDQWFPAIATDGKNHFIVTWEDYRDDTVNYTANIYAKGIGYDGGTVFDDKAVCTAAEDQRFPRVAYSTGEDSFVIAWEDYRIDPINYISDIYAQKIGTLNGNPFWTPNGEAVSNATDTQDAPSITSSDTKGVITTWEDFRSGDFYDTYAMALPVPGSVTIGNGSGSTNTRYITLNLWGFSFGNAISQMCISNDNATCSSWEGYSTTKSWTLSPGEGDKVVYVQFKDIAGNVSPAYFDKTTYTDTFNGSINGSISINGGATYTNTSSVILTISATSASQMCISNDNASCTWEAYSVTKNNWTLSPGDGVKTVYVSFKDSLGNVSDSYSNTITLDTVSPSTTASPAGGNYDSLQTVTLTCDDGTGSGCSKIYYTTNGTDPTTSSSIFTGPISITGDAILKYFAVDLAGNAESIIKSQTYNINTSTPSTTASPTGGLYKAPQIITLESSKPAISTIYYTTDGTPPTISSTQYTSPISISSSTILKFFARDTDGNQEYVKTEVYTIDTAAPTGTISINSSAAFTKSTNVILTISASDANGVSQMQFSDDNATYTMAEAYATSKAWILPGADGTKTVYVKFKDNAGNWSGPISDNIILDTVAPATTATPAGGNYPSVQTVTLACNDGTGSGCSKIYYTTDGSTPDTNSAEYAGPVSITANTTLKFFAVDLVGNVETPSKTEVYNIDVTPPVTTASIAGGIYNSTLSVSLLCSDGSGSGCDKTYYCIGTGCSPTTEYAAAINVNTSATLRFYSTDVGLNSEAIKTEAYTIDTIPPTGSISSATYTSTSTVSFTISASDVGSGVTEMKITGDGVSLRGRGWLSYSESETVNLHTPDGTKTVSVQFRDAAGNISATYSSSITFDTTPPAPEPGVTPTISLDSAVVTSGWTYYSYSKIAASWTSFSDATAGLQEYKIAIGTSDGGTNILNWTGTAVPSYTTGDISSEQFGKTLYISVKAVDNLGMESNILSTSFIYTPADINSKAGQGDGRVDGFDLGKLGIEFGSSGQDLTADINRDGKVDGNDLIVLGTNFGKVKP